MIVECDKRMEFRILSYLEKEPEYNTLLAANMQNFGFDSKNQRIFVSLDNERIQGVFLANEQDLLVSGQAEGEDREFFELFIDRKRPQRIMGKEADILKLKEFTREGYLLKTRSLYCLRKKDKLEASSLDLKIAEAGDEDKIFNFLMSVEEIKKENPSKELIQSRLRNKDGFHYYLEMNNEITAHGNSMAIGPYSAMIHDVCVKPQYRKNGIGGNVVSQIAEQIFKMGLIPCVISDRAEENNLFVRIGFEKVGTWAMLERW